nr:FK506-binding protein 4-like [Drosophila bipectinata]
MDFECQSHKRQRSCTSSETETSTEESDDIDDDDEDEDYEDEDDDDEDLALTPRQIKGLLEETAKLRGQATALADENKKLNQILSMYRNNNNGSNYSNNYPALNQPTNIKKPTSQKTTTTSNQKAAKQKTTTTIDQKTSTTETLYNLPIIVIYNADIKKLRETISDTSQVLWKQHS